MLNTFLNPKCLTFKHKIIYCTKMQVIIPKHISKDLLFFEKNFIDPDEKDFLQILGPQIDFKGHTLASIPYPLRQEVKSYYASYSSQIAKDNNQWIWFGSYRVKGRPKDRQKQYVPYKNGLGYVQRYLYEILIDQNLGNKKICHYFHSSFHDVNPYMAGTGIGQTHTFKTDFRMTPPPAEEEQFTKSDEIVWKIVSEIMYNDFDINDRKDIYEYFEKEGFSRGNIDKAITETIKMNQEDE